MRRCADGWPKAWSRSARGASGWRGTQQTALANCRPSSTPTESNGGHAMRCEVRAGRREGVGRRRRKQHAGEGLTSDG